MPEVFYVILCDNSVEQLIKSEMSNYFITACLALLMSLAATAEEFYDFKVNGIAYKINEEDAATVSVAKEQDPNIPETNYTSYANLTGKLTLPEQVTHEGVTYTVTAIGLEAFQGCSGLTGELVLPSTIKLIDHWAFYQCTGLTGHVIIPNGVTSIGYAAFGECDGLTGFTIPATARSIDPGALDGAGVQTVVSLIDNFTSYAARLNYRMFHYTGVGVDMTTCRLIVPNTALSLYRSFMPWNGFEHIDVLENADGMDAVDVADVNLVINVMLGKVSDTPVLANADVNRDGAADVSDVNNIINAMLGKAPSVYDASVTVDMAGTYNTDMGASTYIASTYAERAEQYGKTTQCTGITLANTVPGIFYCRDLFAGYFDQICGYGFTYRMGGYLRVDNDGNVTLLSSYCQGWEDGIKSLSNGHFDSATGALTYDLQYSGVSLHVVLQRQ